MVGGVVRILVTGSRAWVDGAAIEDALVAAVGASPGPVIVVHGAAKGADALAGRYARQHGWTVESHPALWHRYRKRAGLLRNQAMVDLGADLCLAFPGPESVGTWDCVRRARVAGIPTVVYGEPVETAPDLTPPADHPAVPGPHKHAATGAESGDHPAPVRRA